MDSSIEISTILAIAGAITAVGGAWLTIRKIAKDFRRERELEKAQILHQTKEELNKFKLESKAERATKIAEIDASIDRVQSELNAHKESVEKDLQHMRETYNGEIRNLGQKIEDLRTELRTQHGQLVGLLTKMIEPKD